MSSEWFRKPSQLLLNRNHSFVTGKHACRALTCPWERALRAGVNRHAIAKLVDHLGESFRCRLVGNGDLRVDGHWFRDVTAVIDKTPQSVSVSVIGEIVVHRLTGAPQLPPPVRQVERRTGNQIRRGRRAESAGGG